MQRDTFISTDSQMDEKPSTTDYISYKEQLRYLAQHTSPQCQQFINQFMEFMEAEKAEEIANPALLFSMFQYKKIETPRQLCGKILQRDDPAFKCLDCMLQDNSIICIECFNKSNHSGHNFEKILVYGGCCDCGDEQKWKAEGSCVDHTKSQKQIQVDLEETDKFINQMKFLFYVLLRGYYVFDPKSQQTKHKLACKIYSKSLGLFLKDFNQDSAVSNEMTHRMLVSPYPDTYSDLSYQNDGIKIKDKNLLHLIYQLRDLNDFEHLTVEIFTVMFTRIKFKEQLTVAYANALVKNPTLVNSDFSHISCQIFTSHRIIRKLIDEDRFPVLSISALSKELKYEEIANTYVRYYIDIAYLSRLYNDTGVYFLKHQFGKGSVSTLIGYEEYALKNYSESINYYGIEEIFFKYFFPILKILKNQKQLLKKMMRDLVLEIKNFNITTQTVYNTKERTFAICLFQYCQGDLRQALSIDFLQDIGLLSNPLPDSIPNDSPLLKMFKSTMFLFSTYGKFLSNRESVDRFYTFYSFSFNKNFRLLSMDYFLAKFCILVLKKLNAHSSYFTKIFKKYSGNITDIINTDQFIDQYQANYDRRRSLGICTDYIGLLAEMSYLDHPELTLKCMLDIDDKDSIENFYCSLLASLGDIKVEEFKKCCQIFLGDELPYFAEFVNQCGIISNKKLNLKQQHKKAYPPFRFSFLKSKKLSPGLEKARVSNIELLASCPKEESYRIPSPYEIYPIDLKRIVFCQDFVQNLIQIGKKYLAIMEISQPSILQKDLPYYSLYLDQLLHLYFVIRSEKLLQFFKTFSENQAIVERLNEKLKLAILFLVKKESVQKQEPEEETFEDIEKKIKQQERKKNKIQSLKAKQRKAFEKYRQSPPAFSADTEKKEEESPDEDSQKFMCMICKVNETSSPLCLMSFIQKSTIVTKNYLRVDRPLYSITSCNHTIHQACYNKIYGNRDYSFCNLCKNSCNLLLVMGQNKIQEKQPQKEASQSQINCVDRIQISIAMLDPLPEEKSLEEKKQESLQSSTMEEQKQEELSATEKMIQSIASSILSRVMINDEAFIRNQAFPCYFLLSALRNKFTENICIKKLMKTIEQQHQKQSDEETGMIRACYRHIVSEILRACNVQDLILWKEEERIPPAVLQNISDTFDAIENFKINMNSSDLKLEPIKPYRPLKLRRLPKNLAELSQDIGICPNCHRTTNQICICLICPDFKSCLGCQSVNLTKHASQDHGGSTIFVRIDAGLPIHISLKKKHIFPSIYYNFLLEPYPPGKREDRSKYYLEEQDYKKIENLITRQRIEQELRYFEIRSRLTSDKIIF